MKVLVACEFSGVVRNAFLARGHDAYSCDVYPGLKPPHDRHLQEDVEPLLKEPWDLVVAHPPCTYLCNSGVWLMRDVGRRIAMIEACRFFRACLDANAPKVCVENPVPHKYALEYVGEKYTQTFQPHQFGDSATKRTCLWLKGLPNLRPTGQGMKVPSRVWMDQTRSSSNRRLLRSITYPGVAEAMAEQWG